MSLNDAMIKVIAEKQDELKTLRKRVREQRLQISGMLEVTDRLVFCKECIYRESGDTYGYHGAHYCKRSLSASQGVLDDDFCSMGQRKPYDNETRERA